MRGACEPPPARERALELKGKAGPVQSFGGKWRLRVKNQERLRVHVLLSPDWGAGLGKKKDCSAAGPIPAQIKRSVSHAAETGLWRGTRTPC